MKNIEKLLKYSKNLNLLYVEENKEVRETTVAILKKYFKEIVTAESIVDMSELFKIHKIDLIITEINLFGEDCLEILKDVKEIPIIILSSHNGTQHFIDCIKLGIEGYLMKPLDLEQLLIALCKVTEKIRLHYEALNNLNLLEQYQDIIDKASIVSKTDTRGYITYANDEFCRISGYSREELIGKNHNIIRHPDNPMQVYKDLWHTIRDKKQVWQKTLKNLAKNGKSYYVQTVIKPILNYEGEILEYIALRNNITDFISDKNQLQDLIDTIDNAIVVFVKIDGFENIEKYYSQKLAHIVEDKFAKELFDYMPKEFNFKRVFFIDNGEYAFASDLNEAKLEKEDILHQLKIFQENVNKARINLGELEYDMSVIVSVAYGEDVLENAKYGLLELKRSHQDFILANNLLQKEQFEAHTNLQTLKMVKSAIDNFRVVSYFQPIIDNKTKEIVKYESLVRIIDEDGDVISPFFFLDTAKQGKYYSQITSIVLDNSFNALKHTDMDISINISALDIERSSTREKLYELLAIHKEELPRIMFELLEDESVKDFETIKTFILDVKSMGVKIAIDDFGTGYSNFERLLDYQPDILKIDGSLIKNIEDNYFSMSVVKTIVAFAKTQNIKTVAEYVENENIYNILKDLEIDYSQGYYFGKPEVLEIKSV